MQTTISISSGYYVTFGSAKPTVKRLHLKYRRVFLEGHSYFFTLVTYERNPILIENIGLLRESFTHVKRQFSFTIDAIVILPDHIHMIVMFEDVKEYPKIIGSIKRYFSSHCDPKYYRHLMQSHSREEQHYKPVWQKRFYEHTIRDERDYKLRLNYIHYNPVKHKFADSAAAWEYSSFGKFMDAGYHDDDWGAFDESIDFE